MAVVYETKAPSNHIEISAFPSAAVKGGFVKIGSLTGLADYAVAANTAGSINTGKPRSVFQAAINDLSGTAAVGTDVYVTSAGAFSTTASGNTLVGTSVYFNSEYFEFATA